MRVTSLYIVLESRPVFSVVEGVVGVDQILDYVNNLVHLGLLQVGFAGQTNLFSHEPGTGHRLTDLLAVPVEDGKNSEGRGWLESCPVCGWVPGRRNPLILVLDAT